jgi:hypothetical protein
VGAMSLGAILSGYVPGLMPGPRNITGTCVS